MYSELLKELRLKPTLYTLQKILKNVKLPHPIRKVRKQHPSFDSYHTNDKIYFCRWKNELETFVPVSKFGLIGVMQGNLTVKIYDESFKPNTEFLLTENSCFQIKDVNCKIFGNEKTLTIHI